jgi:hypothetical protein
MGCQSRDYTSSDGFLPVYYLGESIKSSICGINNEFKSMIGGTRKKKKVKGLKRNKRNKSGKSRKSRKYKQYTNGKKHNF